VKGGRDAEKRFYAGTDHQQARDDRGRSAMRGRATNLKSHSVLHIKARRQIKFPFISLKLATRNEEYIVWQKHKPRLKKPKID
jgi:hypothetical protein